MANKIHIRRGPNKPSSDNLDNFELGINTTGKKLYTKIDDEIFEMGAGAQAEGENSEIFNNYEGSTSGKANSAEGQDSAVFGVGNMAKGNNQFVFGSYNEADTTSIEVVGGGYQNETTVVRKNVRTLDKEGNQHLAGDESAKNIEARETLKFCNRSVFQIIKTKNTEGKEEEYVACFWTGGEE